MNLRLGERRHINGTLLEFRGKGGNCLHWWNPHSKQVVSTGPQVCVRTPKQIEATEYQKRLAEQVGLDVREVVKITGGAA